MRKILLAWAVMLALLAGGAPHAPAPSSPVSYGTGEADRTVDTAADTAIAALVATAMPKTASASTPPIAAAESPSLSGRHFADDLAAMRLYRPGYRFWHHVFTVPNGWMAYGSAADGSLFATFPLGRDWAQEAHWVDGSLPYRLPHQLIRGRLSERRDSTAELLTPVVGPVVYHETRGSFIEEGTERYGAFLDEWGAIFERFGVPAELGLAQALVESGLRGRVRSEAGAIGLCQWLPRNWERLQATTPFVIEAYNQTTQAAFCAAHLAILSTKYGSLIPALSEHHAGGANVGRTIINGDFAGGDDVRARYFRGAELSLLVRRIRLPGYREVAGTYGPRSFRYAEMVFGNLETIEELSRTIPQEPIFAMRPDRAVSLEEVAERTGLSIEEIRRFNPALINRVPATAALYLPFSVEDFGADTSFWHRPPAADYVAVLQEFLSLDERSDSADWQDAAVIDELRGFAARFRATATEEGAVMASVIDYVVEDLDNERLQEILAEARTSERVRQLLERGISQMRELLPVPDERGGGWADRNALLTTASFRVPGR